MSSSPSRSYSRSSSASGSARSSRSISPRPSRTSGFLNYLYQQKTFNLLLGFSILFLIVILSFSCFEVKKTTISENCKCDTSQYYNGQGCTPLPDLDKDFEDIKNQIRYELKDNTTIASLREIDEKINNLDDQIIYAALYQLNYYVNGTGDINSCNVEENCLGYEITVIILFIISCALAIISFLGRNSYF